MRILVTGSNGQLGSEIKDIAKQYKNFDFYFTDRNSLNICDSTKVKNFLLENEIEVIINCAAYTKVEAAENNREKAFEVNSKAVADLVSNADTLHIKIIHISTDYVFDGTSYFSYNENDVTNPLNVYGKSKLEGENFLVNSDVNGIVIRTSWLYSQFGSNFVKSVLRLGTERNSLGVVSNEVGSPTNAKDLAIFCLELLAKNKTLNNKGKVYHYSNHGVASWFDFAKAIMEFANIECMINAIETKDYSTFAKRPIFSVLNKSNIEKDFNIQIPFWRDSLKKCIETLKKKHNETFNNLS
jgi:dTDP-4-dehydrorhamnose reductase